MKRKTTLLIALAIVIVGISAGLSLATPGSGFVNVQFGRETMSMDLRIRQQSGKDIVVTENSFNPGGFSGWHSHPGWTVLAVQRGSVTFYQGDDPTCSGTTLVAGDVFLEPPHHVINARNESTSEAAVTNTMFFNVPAGASARIDEPKPPQCPF
jgi:quercetin dioxygenase-like cupin family protein